MFQPFFVGVTWSSEPEHPHRIVIHCAHRLGQVLLAADLCEPLTKHVQLAAALHG